MFMIIILAVIITILITYYYMITILCSMMRHEQFGFQSSLLPERRTLGLEGIRSFGHAGRTKDPRLPTHRLPSSLGLKKGCPLFLLRGVFIGEPRAPEKRE